METDGPSDDSTDGSPKLVMKNTFLNVDRGHGRSRVLQRSASAPDRCFHGSGDLALAVPRGEGELASTSGDPSRLLVVQEPPADISSGAQEDSAAMEGALALEATTQASIPKNVGKGSHSEAWSAASTQLTHGEQRSRLQQPEGKEHTQQRRKGPARIQHPASAQKVQVSQSASTQQPHEENTRTRQVHRQPKDSSTENKLHHSTRAESARGTPFAALEVGEQLPTATNTLQHEHGRYPLRAASSTEIIRQRVVVPASSPAAAGASAVSVGPAVTDDVPNCGNRAKQKATDARVVSSATNKGKTSSILTPKGVGKVSPHVNRDMASYSKGQAAATENELQIPTGTRPQLAVAPTAPAVETRRRLADEKLRLHESKRCTPCAYFRVKADGCRQGEACEFCHICTLRDLRIRKALVKRESRNPGEFRQETISRMPDPPGERIK